MTQFAQIGLDNRVQPVALCGQVVEKLTDPIGEGLGRILDKRHDLVNAEDAGLSVFGGVLRWCPNLKPSLFQYLLPDCPKTGKLHLSMQLDASTQVYLCLSRATGKDRETISARLALLNHFEVNERLSVIASDKQTEDLVRFVCEGLERLGDVTLIHVPNATISGGSAVRDRLTQIFQGGVETVFDKPTGK